jgi:hypothetical protein
MRSIGGTDMINFDQNIFSSDTTYRHKLSYHVNVEDEMYYFSILQKPTSKSE